MAKARPRRDGNPEPRREPDRPAPPDLSSRHRRTLESIFQTPNPSEHPRRDIDRLFVARGGTVESGSGSRRRVRLAERKAVFHEPHPERVTDKGAVEDVRGFLLSAGVRP